MQKRHCLGFVLHMDVMPGKNWIRSLKTRLRRGKRSASSSGTATDKEMEAAGGSVAREEATQLLGATPSSPPPSYEHAIAESRLEEAGGGGGRGGDREEEDDGGGEEAVRKKEPEELLIVHKSSKELYKALAAQWGITCKMSDHCRCYDCQSHYFDCEYDRDNDHEKTDGGLGAGTPMFISEVMHGTACSIL